MTASLPVILWLRLCEKNPCFWGYHDWRMIREFPYCLNFN